MPMAFPLLPFLYLLLTPLAWAGPPSTEFLTPTLTHGVPACAQTCLEFFIVENFPSSTCGSPPNFDCLCTSDSTSGFTIGEGALDCLASECEGVYESEESAVYEVCSDVQNAKLNTHGTLTATIIPAASMSSAALSSEQTKSNIPVPSFPSTSYTSSSFSATAAASAVSGVSTTIVSASPPISHSSSSVVEHPQTTNPPVGGVIPPTTGTTSSTPSQSATAAPASSTAPVLTKPQIAGVVVASIGAAAIAFGLCFFIFSLHRRKSDRRHSGSSFGGDKVIDSVETTPDMSAIATRDFGSDPRPGPQAMPMPMRQPSPTRQLRLETPATSSEDGWGQYQRDMGPGDMELAVGLQVPRSVSDEHSPMTPASNRTRTSQLLPDKPTTYSLFPSPLHVTPRNSIPNQNLRSSGSPRPPVPPLGSPFARSAPQHPGSMDTSQAHLQGGNGTHQPGSDPFLENSSRSPPSIYSHFQASRPRTPPRSTRRDPPRFRVPSWEQPESSGVVRKPLPAHQPLRAQGLRQVSVRTEQPSLPRTYPARPPIEQHYLAAIENSHRRKPSRKESNASRPLTFFSSGSETSFENIDDEDDDAPDPRSVLSPVAEVRSPPAPARAGRISYPAIPTSAAESPTRRPKKPAHPDRSDSLLSKRLGQDRAREISDRLQDPRQPRSPGKGEVRPSAKWKSLVSPGYNGIEKSGSPSPARTVGRTPPEGSTPWRR